MRDKQGGIASRTALHLGLALFFSMNVMVCSLVLWSWDAYAIASSDHATLYRDLLRLLAMLFATPVIWLLGTPLVDSLADQWRSRRVTTDGLLLLGVLAAFSYSVASVFLGGEHIYFEVACMILLAVTLGRWLEAEGKQKAMQSLQSLRNLLPATASLIDSHGQITTVELPKVTKHQLVRILPGERLPIDGKVESGHSFIDESFVTGESEPVSRKPGDRVYAGTMNLDGRLEVRVTAAADEGVVSRLISAVRTAAMQRSRVERQADRLTRIFLPLVVATVVLTFAWHFNHSNLGDALLTSMAVALIACPCALAIATPLAVWAALGAAARHQVVFRKSDDLLALAELDLFCFDKTGTLTERERRLSKAAFATDPRTARSVAQQLAQCTQHPLAAALSSMISAADPPPERLAVSLKLETAHTTPGKGVSCTLAASEATSGESEAILGSRAFCEQHGLIFPDQIRGMEADAHKQGWSVVFVGWGDRVEGCFAFEESLRADAAATVGALGRLGIETYVLSGDTHGRVASAARELGIEAVGSQLPEDKQEFIRNKQVQGRRVAMVGDGLNDAPSLSLADVGIALGCGVEVTRDAADVCLMSSELSMLPWAVELARRTKRTIARNLLWSFVYNIVGITLAATGQLNPIVASLAMVLSSGFVIVESLRLTTVTSPAMPDRRSPFEQVPTPDRRDAEPLEVAVS